MKIQGGEKPMEFALVLFVFPLAVLLTSIFGFILIKRWFIMPILTFLIFFVLTFIIFNISFMIWTISYTILSLIVSFILFLVFKKS